MSARHDDYDDDLLRHYYEQELERLRREMRAFAQRHPQAAARLSINSDGRSDDAGVERLAQSTALLHARHSAKIDDDYPELSEALIQRSYPQYLRPFPSCALAQFDVEGVFDSLAECVRVARGTRLQTTVGQYVFRTSYEVVLAPLRIARAQYLLTPAVPASVTLPPDTSGMLSVSFAATSAGAGTSGAMPATLRTHIAGEPPIVAALIDTLLLRATSAYVEDGNGRWTRLPAIPVAAVGFGAEDWLFTDPKEPGQALGLLGEYFAFAGRFHFVDIDFASLHAAAPGEQLTLHLVVAGAPAASRTARQLIQVSADNLRLFCTPVVNLFEKKGVSVKYDADRGEWPIEVESKSDAHTEVWSVDRVCTEHGMSLRSSAALMTSHASHAQPRWTLVQRRPHALSDTAQTATLRLAGADGAVGAGTSIGTLRVDVTCTNGDRPCSLRLGAREGDMRPEGETSVAKKVWLLQVPTVVAHLSRTNGALWRLIDQQSTHSARLSHAGLPALKQLLQQFAVLSPSQGRHIDGITGLCHRLVMALVARAPQPAMVRAMEVTLEVDEQFFAANSIAVFARVMERLLAPYASTNNFVQLVVVSLGGETLWRGEPVKGEARLL